MEVVYALSKIHVPLVRLGWRRIFSRSAESLIDGLRSLNDDFVLKLGQIDFNVLPGILDRPLRLKFKILKSSLVPKLFRRLRTVFCDLVLYLNRQKVCNLEI